MMGGAGDGGRSVWPLGRQGEREARAQREVDESGGDDDDDEEEGERRGR